MADEKASPGSSEKKKKSKYYYYVSSHSDEADTLKDRFWRNLEEGKIDVMQTTDLYSKVKCNKKPLGLLVNSFGNAESPVSTFDCSPSSSCGSSTKSVAAPFSVSGYETGSLLSDSPLVDSPIHSPFRNLAPEFGHQLITYDHSNANVALEQSIWDDLERRSSTSSTVITSTWQSTGETNADNVPLSLSSDLDNLSERSRPYDVSPDTDDTLICAADVDVARKGSRKKIPRCKPLATKRRRNNGCPSRRKTKHRPMSSSNFKLDTAREHVDDSNCRLPATEEMDQIGETVSLKSKRPLVPSDSGKDVQSKRKQFYTYVDVSSEAADTLKDKFWRNLDRGILDLSEAGDLYSKVKGNRKVRSWNSNSQINYDAEEASMESSLTSVELEAVADDTAGKPCRRLGQLTTLAERKRGRRTANSAAVAGSMLPVTYVDVDLTETEASSVLGRTEDPEITEVLLLSDEEDIEKTEKLKTATEAEFAGNDSEAVLSSSLLSTSSDSLDEELKDSLLPSATSQSTNDSKLLGTCEVTVERLRPDKVASNEETKDAGPNRDHVIIENLSLIATNSPDVGISSPRKTGQEYTSSSNVAETSSDCFDNIDFDPSSPLDDLRSSSDVEFPDILDLAASVAGSSGRMADLLTRDRTILETASEDDLPNLKRPVAASTPGSLEFTSELYAEMKNALMDPTNIFDGSWPKCFLSRWNVYLEDALRHAITLNDQRMSVALVNVMPTGAFAHEQRDSDERTLLMRTVEQGDTDVARALVSRGASAGDRDRYGNTPLMISSEKGHHNTAKLLIECGAHIDATNKKGETALMIAVNCGCVEVVALLLLKGTNFSVTNFNHQTAMNLAKINHRDDILELLNAHITRLTQKLWTVIMHILSGVGETVSRLFPIQCFSLRDSTIFTVNFINYGRSSDNSRPVLFIGHTIIGEENVHCVLHGPCAVLKVTLNGNDLRSFSREGMFLLALDRLSNGANELVIHTIKNEKSELKLLVCAHLVQPCNAGNNPANPHMSV